MNLTEDIPHIAVLTVKVVCQVTTITVLQTEQKAQLIQGKSKMNKKNSKLQYDCRLIRVFKDK